MKQLNNSLINVKRSELPPQMAPLVPYLSNGLGVKIPFQGVLKEHSKVLIRMDYFHLFIIIWIVL